MRGLQVYPMPAQPVFPGRGSKLAGKQTPARRRSRRVQRMVGPPGHGHTPPGWLATSRACLYGARIGADQLVERGRASKVSSILMVRPLRRTSKVTFCPTFV